MDLFAHVVPKEQQHDNFRQIDAVYTSEQKQVLSDWAAGFVDRDGKFVKEFQTTFNSSFWELYLFACLKELDLKVDFRFASPDFVITNFWREFCIEAGSSHNAAGAPGEWQKDWSERDKLDVQKVVNEATIRLANTVITKYRKYQTSYRYLAHVQRRPFVLAVAPFEQPWFHVQNDQAILRVLYGYDKPEFKLAPGASRASSVEHLYMDAIKKPSGAEIALGFFRRGGMPEISAVIFSNVATSGKVQALSGNSDPNTWFLTLRFNANGDLPIVSEHRQPDYHEDLLDGVRVYHNASAAYPLDRELFDRPGVFQYFFDEGDEKPRYIASHGALLQRTVMGFRTRSKDKAARAKEKSS